MCPAYRGQFYQQEHASFAQHAVWIKPDLIDPRHTRDMVLETLANGARGVTYYWYGHFDAAHFKHHADAVDIVAPIEDIFVDGTPLAGLECSHAQVKLCGMGLDGELAVLVSNYGGPAPATNVTVRTSAAPGRAVWDLHSGQRIGETGPGGSFAVVLGDVTAHLFYLGSKYAAAVPRE